MSVSTTETAKRRSLDRNVRITVARTLDQAEALRPWFARVPPSNIDAALDYSLTVVRGSGSMVRPHIMLFELPDSRAMLVVSRIHEQRSSRRVGGRPLLILQVAFGGVVGAETAEDCRLVVDALCDTLAQRDADVVVLPQLNIDGSLYGPARSAAPWWRTNHLTGEHVHWRAEIPTSIEAFLKARSRKTRSNMRYYRNKVVAAHGGELAVREFRDAADIDRLCEDIESIAAHTYQRGLAVGYTGDALQLDLMRVGARNGWLRAWVLYIAEVPAAFWFGYSYNGTFCSVANGFNPEYGHLRIGQYLQMEGIERLCAEPDVHSLDWGTGDAEYKRRFGDLAVAEADVVLYAASVRAVGLNAVRTARAGAARPARAWVARTKLGARVKRTWRKRAERRAQSQAA